MSVYLPLISAFSVLLGAVIGSASSIITMYIQTRVRDRRDRIEQVARMATEDYKAQHERTRLHGGSAELLPMVVYFDYYQRLMDAAESGELSREKIIELGEKNEVVINAVREAALTRNNF